MGSKVPPKRPSGSDKFGISENVAIAGVKAGINRGEHGDGNQEQQRGGNEGGRTMATVLGGIAGAVLGSKIGGGTGSVAASAIGTMVGGMAGRQVYDNAHRQQRTATVSVCDPVPVNDYYGGANNAVTAYDVTYEYAGRRYTTRTGYNPGDRIRVRVDVHPE